MLDLDKKLIKAEEEGVLLDALSEAEVRTNNSPEDLSAALIRIHVDHGVDVVGQFQNLENSGDRDFFGLRWLLEPALSEMDCPTDKVMRCVVHLTREAGQDMTANQLIGPFIDFCGRSTTRPDEALRLAMGDVNLSDLLSPALVAGSRLDLARYHEKAVELARNSDLELRRRAIHSLGQLQYNEAPPLMKKSMAALRKAVAQESDDLLLGNAVMAAFRLYELDRDLADGFIDLVTQAVATQGDFVLHAASELIAFSASNLPDRVLPLLSDYLIEVSPSNIGTIRNIGLGIQTLLRGDDPGRGIKLLETLLVTNGGATNIDALMGVTSSISQSPELRNKLATRWFMNGNPILGQAIAKIIKHEHAETPALAADPDELPNTSFAHIYFVARKAVGYLFLYPTTAATFVLSLIELAPDSNTRSTLTELLFDPLMLNYPGALKTAFEKLLSKDSNDATATACREVSDRFETYVAEIKSVGEISEHRPPQSHQELHFRKFTREMSEAMKEAQANSVLLSIVKKSVLLYGRKWITYVDHPNQPTRRMESDLQSVETSMDMPRMQIIDPLGLDYMLRVFRVEQLKT